MLTFSGFAISLTASAGTLTASIGDEEPGQVAAFDSNQRVGSPVLRELLTHWTSYENSIPEWSR